MALKIAPDQFWGPRLLVYLVTLTTAFLLYIITKKEFGEISAHSALWLSAPLLFHRYLTLFFVSADRFMILPLTSLIALFIFKKDSVGYFTLITASLLGVITIMIKPTCLLIILLIYLFFIYKLYQQQKKYPLAVIKKIVFFITTFIFLIFLTTLPHFLKDHYKTLYESVFLFNKYVIQTYGLLNKYFWYNINNIASLWWVLIFPIIGYIYFFRSNNKHFFLLITLTGIITINSATSAHYFYLFLPSLIIISAIGITVLINKIVKLSKINYDESRAVNIFINSLIIFFLLYPLINQVFVSTKNLCISSHNNTLYYENFEIGKQIRKMSNPEDKILVVGQEPQIYYYSQKKSITRFISTIPLNVDSPFKEQYRKEYVNQLINEKPKFIAYVKYVEHNNPEFSTNNGNYYLTLILNIIKKEYELSGASVWNIKDNQWQSSWKNNINLTKNEIENANVLLYQKKNIKEF